MATAALLGSLLSTNVDIAYCTQQQIFWANKYELNAEKLQKQVKYETKWESEFDKAMDETRTSALKYNYGGLSGTINKECAAATEDIAEAYAFTKVEHFNRELSIELAELDVEYDTMKCMYETMLETLRAQEETEKTATSTSAQDTNLLNAG